jgi:translation elongation factor EF-Tu-like GTPase
MAASGGRTTPMAADARVQVRIYTATVSARFSLDAPVAPGGSAGGPLTLEAPVPVRAGDRFEIMEGGRVIGSGMVTATTD